MDLAGPLVRRFDGPTGLLALPTLSVLAPAVAVNPVVGLLSGGLVVVVGPSGVDSDLNGLRAYAETAAGDTVE